MTREEEVRMLLDRAWQAIEGADPNKIAPLLNTANRLSKELAELEKQAATSEHTGEEEEGTSAVAIFQARLRKRDTEAS
jgi:hypothetical protein|nr:MAG TPA: hypothetical protein [Caudoviricetes sp.]